jgi:very-short-patch-repair endonuclease
VPAEESAEAAQERTARRAWLTERGYRVLEVRALEAETDTEAVVERLARELTPTELPSKS